MEQLVKQYQQAEDETAFPATTAAKRLSAKDYEVLQRHLTSAFGVKVKFACDTSGKGKITFPFKSEAELERIITIFDQLKAH